MSKPTDNTDKRRRLTVPLDPDLYGKFRKHCFEHDLEMTSVIREFVEKVVSLPSKKGAKR